MSTKGVFASFCPSELFLVHCFPKTKRYTENIPGFFIADLVEGDVSADLHEDVHQRLVIPGAVNGGAEGLDEPGPGLRGPEAVVVPE